MLQVLTKTPSNFNSYLFRQPAHEGGKTPQKLPLEGQETEENPYQNLYCTACGHHISFLEASCERQGSHEHMQVNPHGVTFVFGCFTVAPGVIRFGRASAEHSWFSGYEWQIVLCGHCQVHLGWEFTTMQDRFFALLLNMLQTD